MKESLMNATKRDKEIIFEAKGIRKIFGPTVALDGVDLTLHRGEIRGVIGENGSGKSTLASIAAGMQQPTAGSMTFKGRPYAPATMIDGAKAGFGLIVQETGTVSGLSIAENIFLGDEARFRRFGLIGSKAMARAAAAALRNVGLGSIDPTMPIASLNLQDRKLVEMAKVMYSDPDVLVVDETTTALSQAGRQALYGIMRRMRESDKAVIFISHNLQETIEQCDSLTVLRDGKLVAYLEKAAMDEHRIKQHMVGREMSDRYYRLDFKPLSRGEVLLEVTNLTTGRGLLENLNMRLQRGEILGIGGLSHCGMHELGRALFGEEPVVSGSVVYAPTAERITDARTAIRLGIGYISKNRDLEALVLTASVKDNIVGAAFDRIARRGIILPQRENAYADAQIKALRIRCSSREQHVQYLSGGNKQKVSFAKWMGRESDILIMDCPTRGVDIGVKAAMYALMEKARAAGRSIVIISEELTELIGMSDRLLILKNGKLSGEFERREGLTESELIEYMI